MRVRVRRGDYIRLRKNLPSRANIVLLCKGGVGWTGGAIVRCTVTVISTPKCTVTVTRTVALTLDRPNLDVQPLECHPCLAQFQRLSPGVAPLLNLGQRCLR
jgi:hypothetical protein